MSIVDFVFLSMVVVVVGGGGGFGPQPINKQDLKYINRDY